MAMMELTGEELLAKVRSFKGELSRREAAEECGYGRRDPTTDKTIVNTSAFDRNLIEAARIAKFAAKPGVRQGPGYLLRVNSADAIVVGSAYTRKLDVQRGDLFRVDLDEAQGVVTLTLLEDQEDEP